MSIQTRFFLYLFLLVIIPLLIAFVLILSFSSDIIGSKSREVVFQSFKQTEFRLNQIIVNTENLSLHLLSNDDVQNLSDDVDRPNAYDTLFNINDLNYFLQQEFSLQSYLHSFLLFKQFERIYSFGQYENNMNELWVQEAIRNKGVPMWTGAYTVKTKNASNGHHVVSLIRAVNDLNRFVDISVEMLTITERALEQAYTENDAWQDDQVVIVDNTGLVISSRVKSEIGKQMGHLPYVQKVLNSSQEGSFQADVNDEDVTIFYYQLARTGWSVIKIVPDTLINEPQKFLGILIIVALLICLLFGIIFSIIQNNGIIRPIKKLKREMDKVKRGNLEFDFSVASKNDEIGQLVFRFKEMGSELRNLIDKVYVSQLQEKEAKLQMLSMQINPHFLYNTLESIRWVAIKHQVNTVADQLEVLSNMFRYSLTKEHHITTIAQEVGHVRNYMQIMNFRFNYIYEFDVEVDESTLQCECPHFVLQPLVENAIQHGLMDHFEEGVIRVSIVREHSLIRIIVEDNGIGTDESYIRRTLTGDDTHSGFALSNIHTRLQLKYGMEYGLQFYSKPGIGTKVELLIPVIIRHDSM